MTPDELLADGCLDVAESAKFLSIGRTHVYALMERGELVFCKIGRRRVIPRQALVKYAASTIRGGWAAETERWKKAAIAE